jgi:hypothetical protein
MYVFCFDMVCLFAGTGVVCSQQLLIADGYYRLTGEAKKRVWEM